MMKNNKEKYLGRTVQLYPGDTASKFGIISEVDDLGLTITITESQSEDYIVGKEYLFMYGSKLFFMFVN